MGAALDEVVGPGRWEIPGEKYHVYFPVKLPEPHGDGDTAGTCDARGRDHMVGGRGRRNAGGTGGAHHMLEVINKGCD